MGFFLKHKKYLSITGRFTRIIGISILVTVLFVSGFNIYTSNVIINQYENDNNVYYSTIADYLYKNVSQDLKRGSFKNIEYFSRDFVKNNIIMFIGVIDKRTNKYSWSSVEGLIGTKTSIGNPDVNPLYDRIFGKIGKENIKKYTKDYGNYLIITEFYSMDTLGALLKIIIKGNFFLLLNFIIFGFLLAWVSARSLTKPIMELAYGAEEFSKGNLGYRAPITSKDEIGKLANAFNDMATRLDNLYSSLEQQVKERTTELNNKNLQLENAYSELKEAQTLMVHNEKMSSLGQLTAGLAHELNNPINFIYGNLSHFKNYSEDLFKIIDSYEEIIPYLSDQNLEKVNRVKDELEYKFIVEDLPMLIKSCQEGAQRCKQIILDLKNFSRLDEAVIKSVDIHEGLDSTLNILHHKVKHNIVIHKDYGDIPPISCYAGQLNQVFMNILDNAIAAIKDKGNIFIKTYTENNNVVIIIKDDGSGIEKDHLSKIYDPFFTTKPVGEGTGLGLSISYKIVKKHNGTIEVESEKGKGTKFIIRLPIEWVCSVSRNASQETPNL